MRRSSCVQALGPALLVVMVGVAQSGLAVGFAGAPCDSALNCSLNGDCVGGRCDCDAAWSGAPTCDVLAFEPLDKAAMPGLYDPAESTWGGYPIKDGAGGYTLVHAQMLNHCPLGSWKGNSVVARAASSTGRVEGPYTAHPEAQGVILPAFAHNPTVRRAADGSIVIYYIGGWATEPANCSAAEAPRDVGATATIGEDAHASAAGAAAAAAAATAATAGTCNGQTWPKTCGPDMPGPNGDCCGPSGAAYNGNGGCGIAMAHAAGLDGPWSTSRFVVADQWTSSDVYCTHTNPAPVFLPNGSVVVAFNAGFCNRHLETIGLAQAASWQGPYRMVTPDAVLRNADGSPHHCEDPFLWRTRRGWHLLVHNQQGPQTTSAYAFSPDAATWTLSPRTPHNCTLRYTDGTTAEATGCGNRPQLVFSDVNGSGGGGGPPLWLVNGAQAAKPGGGKGSWTLFRKLKTSVA